jgi:hypothetical protein
MDVIAGAKEHWDALRRATHHVPTQVAKCIDVDGGIFENVFLLYYVNCTNFVTRRINTGIRNSMLYISLANNFGTVQ